ncbi:MAG TPA: phosphoribosylamine--glycine ligase [Ignavibacteria bacterium]|nr:phosphoribosylamine--glycine ligase [Ignavibacteria bacterium]
MKILLVGNGGRENALAWKIFNSASFKKDDSRLYCTAGNPGIYEFAEPVNIDPSDIENLLSFVKKECIEFTVVGPELPLSAGIVNAFENNGHKIFGPKMEAALIESSKVFSKKLMEENNIPTASYRSFSEINLREAKLFAGQSKYPLVIKADGLAAGKGVIIAKDEKEAFDALDEIILNHIFGKAGDNLIIEEYLDGEEISVFVITDGTDFKILPFSQDHKKILDGEKGKNTGGMGAVAPVMKYMNSETENKIRSRIIEPTLKALRDSGNEFKGCLYCGLMIVKGEPFVIEYNCRFGDPETQAVLPLIESDFLKLLLASAENKIGEYELKLNNKFACCVVLASLGYPDKFETGKEITGFENSDNISDSIVFHSGTKFSEDNKVVTTGGRVLSVVGLSDISLLEAVNNTYDKVSGIRFGNMYYRKDIGAGQLIVDS